MGSMGANRPVRIGNAMGAVTDLSDNMALLVQGNDLDFIVGDWMSEYNMASRGVMKVEAMMSKPEIFSPAAFEVNFLESIEPCIHEIARKKIKLAVNAGSSDTEKLYHEVRRLVEREQVDLKIAWVAGDEVHDAVSTCRKKGVEFKNITTGQSLDTWNHEPLYAQCYLGCWGIVEALNAGADIVICGRVADAAPTMAAAAYWHNWARTSYVELAHALVAGHMIECSYYMTGGNYSGFKSMPRGKSPLLNLPIASIQHDGTFNVGASDISDRGGEVSLGTCRAQLLYELQGKRYYNSDVVAIVDQIKMEQTERNSVLIYNIGYEKPPPTTKVGITAKGGYQAEVHYFIAGLDIAEKAKMLEEQLRYCLDTTKFSKLTFTTTGTCRENPDSLDAATVDFRIFAQSKTMDPVSPANFLKPCLNIVMSAYPGATFGMEQRHGYPKPYNEYFVSIIPQDLVTHIAHMPFAGKDILIDPPTDTTPYILEQEIEESIDPAPLEQFGPTTNGPLGYIVHARSGDKGSDANVGFFVDRADEYEWLRALLSTSYLKGLLQNSYTGNRIERFELPHLYSVHFLLKNHLDRGVSATSMYDALGKNLAEYLRAKHVAIPRSFLSRGRI